MINYFYKETKNNFDIKLNNIGLIVNNKRDYTLTDTILSDYCAIQGLQYKEIQEKYKKLFNYIVGDSDITIEKIKYLLGEKNFKNYLKDIKTILDQANLECNSYYFNVLRKRKEFTNNFYRYNDNISSYDHISSKTGRAKIYKGINYLTMSKDIKYNLKHTKGNILFEIDFKSCEPNLLKNILGIKTKGDLYSHFSSNDKREKLKLAVISTIYGIDINNCVKITGVKKHTVENIKNYFDIDCLKKYLEEKFEKHGHIKNIYGRHLINNNNLLNHFIQSSAADYCFLAFQNFAEMYDIKPIAIIHDALLFETKKENKEKILQIKKLTDPISNISLAVDKMIISE